MAGRSSAIGAGVTDFTVGDAVFGVTDQGIEGAYAERIAINAAIIAKKPDRLSHAEAAALGLPASRRSPQLKIRRNSKPARLF